MVSKDHIKSKSKNPYRSQPQSTYIIENVFLLRAIIMFLIQTDKVGITYIPV